MPCCGCPDVRDAGPDGLRYLTVHQRRQALVLEPTARQAIWWSDSGQVRSSRCLPRVVPTTASGHWLLARLGKRVLRPGGVELTRTLLAHAELTDADVLELAPGLGRTAAEILARSPRSYIGAESDPDAANVVRGVLTELGSGNGAVRVTDAAATGLPDASTRAARAIKVNARPLTIAEWSRLLADHGLVVEQVATAPMALLQPRRVIADEGFTGALRFAKNVLSNRDARKRVLTMRRTFRKHRERLTAVAIVARKPEQPGRS